MVNELTVRYSMPSKYDVAKFGTIYKVMGDGDDYQLYVQLSEDETVANWQSMGYLLEKAFKPFLTDKDFVSCCLHLFSPQGESGCKQLKALSDIIKS